MTAKKPAVPPTQRVGRPSKLTPETLENLVFALKMGATREDAARYAGIEVSTFYKWMQRGEVATTGQYLEFFNAVKAATSIGNVELLMRITAAASGGAWQAAAWILERRNPEEYGRQRIDVTSNGKTLGSASAALDGLSPDEQKRILEAALLGIVPET